MAKPKPAQQFTNRRQWRVAGLMSGTSADGIDVAIVDINARQRQVVAYDMVKYPAAVRKGVLDLCSPDLATVDAICHYNFVIGRLFAQALIETCQKHSIAMNSIDLIGSHGQTIYHIPTGRRFGTESIRSTLQIGEPCIIAEMTGITTVADFRPRDIACGGQGAPLVPFTDHLLFSHPRMSRAIQNIGGIANLTYLPAGGTVSDILAFDSGPGNMIMDAAVTLATNGRKHYDRNGAMARRGHVSDQLLKQGLQHRYYRQAPPKTTGREMFGMAWSRQFYDKGIAMGLTPEDVIATATALTAKTITDAYRKFLPAIPDQIILCGGGHRNPALVQMLRERLPEPEWMTTSDLGIDSDAKESISFAMLAWATMNGIVNNAPTATGAQHAAILGKIIPGTRFL